MYIPKSFALTDQTIISRILKEFSFGTLVSQGKNGLQASHLPFEYDATPNTLRCHMARANPQWHDFDGETEVIAIFTGPHGYISPQWYETELAVPTWNYVAIHAYGVPAIIEDDAEVAKLLNALTARYEKNFETPWQLQAPAEWQENLRRAIVAFEIPIARLEAKAKLSQNRPDADYTGVLSGLEANGQQELATWMKELVERKA